MAEVLRAENISKSFPGVLAVDDVTFTVERGEILALVGENGAGKTTLTQVLGGAHIPDSGNIILEGQPVVFHTPEDAIHAGISMVFQELSLVGSLSVAENIFANRLCLNIEVHLQIGLFLGRTKARWCAGIFEGQILYILAQNVDLRFLGVLVLWRGGAVGFFRHCRFP